MGCPLAWHLVEVEQVPPGELGNMLLPEPLGELPLKCLQPK